MNFRKLSISLFTALFGMLFLCTATSAINIVSREVNKVSVSFLSSEDVNVLKGKVWKKGNLSEGVKVKLELLDSYGAIVERQEIVPEGAQKKVDYWETDFLFDLSDKSLGGEYSLRAEVFNKDNYSIAFGEGYKKISNKESGENSAISSLAIKTDQDMIKGGVKFENKETDGEFRAKIDVYKDDNANSFMGTFLSEPLFVKKGETAEIFFTFSKPADPQLYNAEVYIVQKEQEITGKLMKSFLVEGDFAEFYEAKVSPEKYFEKGDTIEVDFLGVTTTDKDKVLSVEINVTNNDGFSAKKFINVSPHNDMKEFKGKEVFLATQDLDQVFVELILWNENDELGRFKTSTKKFKKPRENTFVAKIKKIQSGEKLSNADKYKIIAVLVFIVFAILLFIRGLVRSNKGKTFFIFLSMIIFSGTAFASYPTSNFYPQNGMGYNSNAGSGEFNKIGFWGYISTINGGYLPLYSANIPYEITLAGVNGEGVFMSSGTYTNNNSYEYKFSIDLNATDFPGGIPVDGDYRVQLRFYGSDIETRLDELSMPSETEIVITFDLSIIVDSTDPDPEFSFLGQNDNGFTNTTFSLTPVCGDGSGTGCYTDFMEFNVTGNFCDSTVGGRTFCSSGAHEFKICDKVGNCTTESADIDFYDPVSPTMTGGDFISSLGGDMSIFNLGIYNGILIPGGEEGGTLTSGNNIDPVNVAATNLYNFGLKDLQDPSTESGLIPDNAYVCQNSLEFFTNGAICIEKEIACAVSVWGRGVQIGGVCTISCPENFEDNGSGECIPSCYYDRFPYCFDVLLD